MIAKLNSLIQIDMDAILSYDQAIANVREEEIRQVLISFREDHLQHIEDLNVEVKRLGGKTPQFGRDFKGFFSEGMTAMTMELGTRAALVAMVTNEGVTHARYYAALTPDLDSHLRAIIERNYMDEERHFSYLKNILKEKFGITYGHEAAVARVDSEFNLSA
jgi:uncharacterized protein (TIGR02284 family)